MKRLLSVDGGGIFGLIPAIILAEIEARTGKQCADLFDLIAGNSTGSIIACGLAVRVPASQLVTLYQDHGAAIFSASLFDDIVDAKGMAAPKYSADTLEDILQAVLGRALLSESGVNLLVPATRCDAAPSAYWFKSWDGDDFFIWQVARASSAAPTYFPAAVLMSMAAEQHTFVDGGLFANNPEDYAAECAGTLWKGEPIDALSLGTGYSPVTVPVTPSWGGIAWLPHIVEFMMELSEQVTEQRAVVGNVAFRTRLNPPIGGAMDDASPGNIAAMKAAAESVINSPEFESYVARITADAPPTGH